MSDNGSQERSVEYEPEFYHPDTVTSDERFELQIGGLPTGEQVTVSASMEDSDGIRWHSRATYDVTNGTVDLETSIPVDCQYSNADTMLLVETMQPEVEQSLPYIGTDETTIEFEVSVDGTALGTSTATRYLADPDITASATPGDLAGTLFEPPGDEPAPAVLVLHGSDGRPMEENAKLFASNGFVALALKYFNFIGQNNPVVPHGLVNLPVEYVDKAVDWLLERDRVSGSTVGVYGLSKGGELGLLAASRNQDIGAVVSLNGSAIVWEGSVYREDHPGATWTIDDEPVPYVPWTDDIRWEELSKPYEYRSVYTKTFEQATNRQIEDATIPIDQINGPVLFIAGKDDQMWNTWRFNKRAIESLNMDDETYDHLVFEDAGHAILTPYRPVANRETGYWAFGGSPDAYREADEPHWHRTLETLRTIDED